MPGSCSSSAGAGKPPPACSRSRPRSKRTERSPRSRTPSGTAQSDILAANAEDVADAKAAGQTAAFLDRLALDPKRVAAMAAGVEVVRALKDPVGAVMESWTRPNGMTIERVRVPLGVVGIIYESRPNVTADAGALCLKAGNAAILRGGSESQRSNRAIHAALAEGLRQAGLPEAAIGLVPTRDRAAVGLMLGGLDGAIDVIVPRGGKDLVGGCRRRRGSRCSPIWRAFAMSMSTRRPLSIWPRQSCSMPRCAAPACAARPRPCWSTAACASIHLKPLIDVLLEAGCEVRGDQAVQAVDVRVKPASEEDWGTEYLDAIIAAKLVDGVDGAIAHVERYGSHHTDAIVTGDAAAAEKFLREVDSAIVLHNASTQFADGGEFGFGAEIGIATGRFHARGPVGVEQLTSFKYRVRGSGQIRP